jgi:hypothetical protein
VSRLTGDAEILGASTVNSNATQNWVLWTKEYAKQLANNREKNAEQATEMHALKLQMQELTAMLAGQNQQGAPQLSGSRATHPRDPGGGVAPQGK